MRNHFALTAGILLLAFLFQSCKKESKTDPCIKDFVGSWYCSLHTQTTSGACDVSAYITIQPSPNGNCEVVLPDLPYRCNSSSYQVLGRVSADSLFVDEQPFGLQTMHASGRLYLNQLTLKMFVSDGTVNTLSGTK